MTEESFTVIEPGSDLGKRLKFTKDKFTGYLCLKDNEVWISAIVSHKPGKHNLTHLFNRILKLGYVIKVPQPFPHMEAIVKAKGFVRTSEYWDKADSDIDVWVKQADKDGVIS